MLNVKLTFVSAFPTGFKLDKTINVGLMWFKLCKKLRYIKGGSDLPNKLLQVSDFTAVGSGKTRGKLGSENHAPNFPVIERTVSTWIQVVRHGNSLPSTSFVFQPGMFQIDSLSRKLGMMAAWIKMGFLTQWLNNLEIFGVMLRLSRYWCKMMDDI